VRRKADGRLGRESCCPALDASRDVRSAMIVQWARRHSSPAPAGCFSSGEVCRESPFLEGSFRTEPSYGD